MKRILLPAVAAVLAAPAATVADEPSSGGTATVAVRADILGTEPGVRRDAITDNVLHHVLEALVAYDADLDVQPMLAESWGISDDGLIYTFRLRDDVTFHNGESLTSEEVKWSWERWLDPETGFDCTNWYDGSEGFRIEAIETPDPLTVEFHVNQPNALFLGQMANFQCITAIVHPDSVDAEGNWIEPIGTGPLRLGDWDKGRKLTLERFDDYRPAPGEASGYAGERIVWLDAVEFVVVPETPAALAGLRAGDLDLVYQLQPTDRAEVEGAANVVLHQGQNLEWNVLLFQTQDPLMSNPAMRKAVAHAIDFPVLAESASDGISAYNPSTVPVTSSYHGPVHERGYERDLEQVNELLAEAGYEGEALKIQTNRRYHNMYENAVIIQAMLQEAGINAELEVLEWPAQLDNYFNGRFQLAAHGYSARTDPVLNYRSMLGSKEANPAFQWGSEEASALVEQARKASDRAERQALFDRVHELMLEEVPTLNLYNHYSIDATHARLQGYELWPAAKPRLWGVWIAD